MTGSQVVRYLWFVSLLIGVSPGSSAATIYTFTTIDVPGGTFTEASGINDAGQIVGRFFSATGSQSQAFVKDGATFTTFDVPGATGGTQASGINDAGQIVGRFGSATGGHGFIKDGATFTTIDVPPAQAQASGINDTGQIVGSFVVVSFGSNHGFVKDGATFTTIDVPAATQGTEALGINDAGQIVGFYGDIGGTPTALSRTARPSPRLISPPRLNTEASGSTTLARSWGHFTMARLTTALSWTARPSRRLMSPPPLPPWLRGSTTLARSWGSFTMPRGPTALSRPPFRTRSSRTRDVAAIRPGPGGTGVVAAATGRNSYFNLTRRGERDSRGLTVILSAYR